MNFKVRGIRGATTVANNTEKEIIEGTKSLLKEMIEKNDVLSEEICSIFFSATKDLDKVFPAKAARDIGLEITPLLCVSEIPVEGDIEKGIRILIHFNTDKLQNDIRHVYLEGAKKLRPDLAE